MNDKKSNFYWIGFHGMRKLDWWLPSVARGLYEDVWTWGPFAMRVDVRS